MRELTAQLIEESRSRPGWRQGEEAPEAAVALLYHRLMPVLGAGGVRALMERVSRRLSEQYGDLEAVAGAGEPEAVEQALRELRGNGTEPDAMVPDLIDALLETLERMIGPELTLRLARGSEIEAGGVDDG